MKLKRVILQNFRGYQDRTDIEISKLTAFIGKNDIGKSTVLEALEIFFNSNVVKMEQGDACVYTDDSTVLIGCVFTDLPDPIGLDSSATTTLGQEYLLNIDGDLEIHKEYNCGVTRPKEIGVYAIAEHPTAESVSDLLQLKQSALKARIKQLGIDDTDINLTSNPAMRQAILHSQEDLGIATTKVPLDKEDAKKVWDALKKELPIYALFQADRESRDDDAEVQDPMKLAVLEAVEVARERRDGIAGEVKQEVNKVAVRTLDKLREISEDLASGLTPRFKSDPNWASSLCE